LLKESFLFQLFDDLRSKEFLRLRAAGLRIRGRELFQNRFDGKGLHALLLSKNTRWCQSEDESKIGDWADL